MHALIYPILFVTISYKYFKLPPLVILAASCKSYSSAVSQQLYRLDKCILPTRYEISFKFDFNFNITKKYLIEKCAIEIEINNELDRNVTKIPLHYAQMEQQDNVRLVDKYGQEVLIDMRKPNIETGMVDIVLVDSKLDSNKQPYTVEFTNVTGIMRDDNLGIYLGDYTFQNQKRLFISTSFRPTQARFAFPCFDEPILMSKFDISLTVPRKFKTIIGNTRIISEYNLIGSELKTITFKQTPTISTHQVAFVISTFERASIPMNSNLNIYYSEGNDRYIQYVANITPLIINKLEEIFQMNSTALKSPEINQIALPTSFFRAVEYVGLIQYKELVLFYDINKSTMDEQRWTFIEVAQIIARLWLVNFISVEWWSHIWLIDGLAIYLAHKIGAEMVPEMELDQLRFVLSVTKTFEVDGSFHSLPLTSKEEDVYNISSIRQKERIIDFYKSPCIFLMIETIMKKEIFFESLRKLLNQHKSGCVNPKQMFDTFEADGLPKGKMEGWTEESGYPVVTVKRINNSAVLSQKRFLLQTYRRSHTKWHIPITFASRMHNNNFANITPSHWLSPNDDLVIEDAFDGGNWIIVNIYENGYYRVNYEESLWESILDVLNSENFGGIPAIIRARLIDDVMSMARVMRQSYHLAMDITTYLEKETDYYPWVAAYNAFSYLMKRIENGSELMELLKKYVALLSIDLSRSLQKYEATPKSSPNQILKTVLHVDWFCVNDYADYVTEARRKFELYMMNPSNSSINANYQYAIFCYGIRNGSSSDWDFLFEQYKKTTFSLERARILEALGCSKKAVILKRYLGLTLDPTIDINSQDYIDIFKSVLNSNVDVAQTFLQDNIEAISQRYANWDSFAIMLFELTEKFTTVAQIAEFKTFVQKNQEALKEAYGDLVQSYIQLAEANVKWITTFEDELIIWLAEELDKKRSCTPSNYESNFFFILLFIGTVFISHVSYYKKYFLGY